MLTVDQIPKLVLDRGYAALADEYSTREEVWRRFVTPSNIIVPSADELTDFPYGHRELDSVGLGDLEEFQGGQRIEEDQTYDGYVRQYKLRHLGKTLTIDEEVMKMRNAESIITGMIVDFARRQAGAASRFRNKYIAGMLQKGTLAAGSTEYFDGSYRSTPDTNKGKIYDGKPWFAASGNAHPFASGASPSGSQNVNLIASAALSSSTLDAAITSMEVHNAYDERGNEAESAYNRPRYLLVPSELRATAIAVTESELLPGTTTNDRNHNAGLVEPIVWASLRDDTDAWWLLGEDCGLKVFDEGLPRFKTIVDEERRLVKVQSMLYFGAHVKNWRGAVCNNKATS